MAKRKGGSARASHEESSAPLAKRQHIEAVVVSVSNTVADAHVVASSMGIACVECNLSAQPTLFSSHSTPAAATPTGSVALLSAGACQVRDKSGEVRHLPLYLFPHQRKDEEGGNENVAFVDLDSVSIHRCDALVEEKGKNNTILLSKTVHVPFINLTRGADSPAASRTHEASSNADAPLGSQRRRVVFLEEWRSRSLRLVSLHTTPGQCE